MTSGLRPAVAWDGAAIEIIDQTELPTAVNVTRLETCGAAIDAIRRLAVRGAPAIGACGALAMVLGIDAWHGESLGAARTHLGVLAETIGRARPTAVNLMWAVGRVRDAASQAATFDELRRRALDEALLIIEEDREACRLIGEFGRAYLAGVTRILTHCNTGRLATLGWGTALGIVYAKAAAHEPVEVYVCEARPLLQGARLTAWELLDAGIDVTLVADSAAAALLDGGRVDAVVVGADRIAANGDTANKIGTFGLAVLARHAGVPFYVAAASSTFDPATAAGRDIVVEERPADEIRLFRGCRAAPPAVPVWNPAFDVTPGALISAYITDVGVLHPPFGPTTGEVLP